MSKFSEMSFPDLRLQAKKLGVNPVGKKPADLLREVEKAAKAKEGKGTPADPKPKTAVKKTVTEGKTAKAPKARDEEEEEEEEEVEEEEAEEEEEETEEGEADSAAQFDSLQNLMMALETVIKKVGLLAMEAAKKTGIKKFDKELVGYLEEEAEEDEEEEEEAPKKSAKPSKKVTKAAAEEEEEEDDEDEEEEEEESDDEAEEEESDEEESDDEEEEETVELSAKGLQKASLEELIDIAKQINKSGKGTIEIDKKSDRIMRARILEFMNEHAEKVTPDGDGEAREVKAAKKSGVPDFATKGADVDVDFGDDGWKQGTIQKVGKKSATVVLDDEDETEVEASFEELRAHVVAKKKVKKAG